MEKITSAREIDLDELGGRCAEIFDEMATSGTPVIVTRAGRVIAQISPITDAKPSGIIGRGKGTIAFVDPTDTLDDLLTKEDIDLWYSDKLGD